MRTRRWGWLFTGLVLAACGGVPQTNPMAVGGATSRVLQTDDTRLFPERATGSSVLSFGGRSYLAERAIDGNPDQEWASTDEDTAPALVLRFEREHSFTRIRIKAWPGSNYTVQLSDDGTDWRDASERLTNTTWAIEEKRVDGRARYMRVRFETPPPSGVRHFSVFEIEIYGDGGYTPPTANDWLTFVDRVDRIGTFATTPDGTPDGHLRLRLNLSRSIEIRTMELFELDRSTRAGTGYVWSTVYASRWLLGVTGPGVPTVLGHRSSLGTFPAGSHTFELYAAEPSTVFSGRGHLLQVVVAFGDGTTRNIEAYAPD